MGDFVSFSNLIAEYTNKGALASVTYIGQLLEYSYDRYDRLIGIDETRSDTSYHTGLQYDNYSRVANKTYPSGYKVYYEYFPNGSKKNVKDAWGNLRDPQTWSANLNRTPRFDRGFTGHEHLYAFGLINMNGRMYDPLLSSFLSPDNYIQDPTTQQGFNRYAYCAYNPLKYVDPSGEQYFGWNGGSSYYDEQAARLVMSIRYNMYLESMQMTMERIDNFSNSLWSQGDLHGGAIGGNGCHGGGGRLKATTRFNRWQQKQDVKSNEGRCVITSLGSIMGGDSTAAWEARADLYRATFDKNPFDPNNLIEFINWNPDPDVYTSYECKEIDFTDIYDAMKQEYVVSAMCDFTNDMADMFGLTNKGHFVNIDYIKIKANGNICIDFNDHPMNNYMPIYKADGFNCFDYSKYKTYNTSNGYPIRVLESIRFIKIKLIP